VQLEDAVALVTAGHVRVGRAISLALAERGCHVHLTYRRGKGAAALTVTDLKDYGVRATAHRVDLTRPGEVARLAEEVWRAAGRVHLLVNNAAVYPKTPLAELTEADWDRCQGVNLKAPFLLCHALGPRMRAAGGGTIVNLTDWAADRPYAGYLPYFVSKAGLTALTRALAVELAPEVRVSAVAPGPVLLPEGTSEESRRAVARATPLGLGDPGDVAAAVVFLAEGAGYTTGAVLHVDGGRHLG